MSLNEVQLKALFISPSIFTRMQKWGWVDSAGRSKEWFNWQRPNHDQQFAEERERKAGPKKFSKEKR